MEKVREKSREVKSGVFFQALNTPKLVFGRGSTLYPGAYDAPPDPLVGWGGGHPIPFPQLLQHNIKHKIKFVERHRVRLQTRYRGATVGMSRHVMYKMR